MIWAGGRRTEGEAWTEAGEASPWTGQAVMVPMGPSHSCAEALTLSVTVFGDKIFKG